MAMTMQDLERTLSDVLERHADVRFAVLFGSTMTRDVELARDVDLALCFTEPRSLIDMGRLAGELEDAIHRDVDLSDVDEATTLLRWEIVRVGRPIFARDPDALLAFQARVPLEYADLRPYLDREAEGLRRALSEGRA